LRISTEVRQLLLEVQLAEQAALELGHDAGHVREPQLVDARLEDLRAEEEQVEVAPHDLLDARALHLHDHAVALVRAREVRLRDRRRRERRVLEVREEILDATAERLLDLRAHLFEREHGRTILERLERLDPLGREDVATHREDLAELDERRAPAPPACARSAAPPESPRAPGRWPAPTCRGTAGARAPCAGSARRSRAAPPLRTPRGAG
jgi:hypothetical protein